MTAGERAEKAIQRIVEKDDEGCAGGLTPWAIIASEMVQAILEEREACIQIIKDINCDSPENEARMIAAIGARGWP